jgi:hypothetical protein
LNTGGGRGEPEDRCLKGTILSCNVTPEWSHIPSLVKWCNDTCPKGGCNKERCKCTCITQDEFLLPKIGNVSPRINALVRFRIVYSGYHGNKYKMCPWYITPHL